MRGQVAFTRSVRFGLLAILLAGLAGCASRQPAPQAPAPSTGWTAAIGKLEVAGAQPCTAILVAADTILTASHCLHQQSTPADPASLRFLPNFGAQPDLAPVQGAALRAQGGAIQEGHLQRPEQVAQDWALVTINPRITGATPIPLANLSTSDIQAHVASGEKLYSAGYGNGVMKSLRPHGPCHIVDPKDAQPVYLTGMLVTTCIIRVGDSGGPLVLLDATGRPTLVGVFAGFGVNAQTGLSYAVNTANILAHVTGGLISGVTITWPFATLEKQVFFRETIKPVARHRSDRD